MAKDIQQQIKKLAEKNLQKMGEWEIAQVPEPIFNLRSKNRATPVLNLVVHRESYFILNTYVCYPEEINSAAKTLLEAIKKHKIIPEILIIREKKIIEELKPIACALKIVVAYPIRLKAIPIVLREMRKTLKQFQ